MAGLVRAAALLLCLLLPAAPTLAAADGAPPLLPAPIWVYNNWSAYDELSDSVPLTEALAMRELREIERLKRLGARFDYYMMDAFWFAPEGGYRAWRKESWPDGPERWIAACRAAGVEPGLWFGTNSLVGISPAPPWRSSLSPGGGSMALYAGGFLPDFMEVLQRWYERGIRMFKFDFADFTAAAPGDAGKLSPDEIRRRNVEALRDALARFRRRNPDAVLVAFNGFGGDFDSTAATPPFRDPVDPRWLQVFDALYSGDPRASDVPEMDFWRSMDIYSDHMVRRFEASGIPLPRIDSTGAMLGDTGTNYHRKSGAWRGMLLLLAARGGWVNTVHGNLEFLDDADARWLARLQHLYAPLQQARAISSFGGIPGEAQPYGFAARGEGGSLFAVVNPAQRVASVALPPPRRRASSGGGRVLFRDAGFVPALEERRLDLGPGELALVGFGRYADAAYDLGVETDIVIPRRIAPMPATFGPGARPGTIEAVIAPPRGGDLRIILEQRDGDGLASRSSGGQPPDAASLGDLLIIHATQAGTPLPVEIRYDKVLWSGLSWAVGEIRRGAMKPGVPIRLSLSTADPDPSVRLEGRVYRVDY